MGWEQIVKNKNNFNDLELLKGHIQHVFYFNRNKEKRINILEKIQDDLLENKKIPFRVSNSEDFYRKIIDYPIKDPEVAELMETLLDCYILE